MWEDWYDYIPTQEQIIVPELACVPEYMSWFRIHGKSYLLSTEERQRQLHVQRERRGPLNLRRRDDDVGLLMRPRQSPGPSSAPIQSSSPATALTQSLDPAVHGPVHLLFRLRQVDRRCIGQRRTRDRKRGCQGVFFLLIPITV
ncbi:hypothetical protein Gotur_027806 [Gossypium turneri]